MSPALAMLAVLMGLSAAPASSLTEADRLVAEGARLAEEGRFDDAIEVFQRAETLRPRAIHDCNIGLAHARAERPAHAFYYLVRCRSRAAEPLPPWVEVRMQKELDVLRSGDFAPVELAVEPAGARAVAAGFLAEDLLAIPGAVWMPFGEYTVEVSRAGYLPETRPLRVDSRTAARWMLALQPETVPTTAPTPAPTPKPRPRRYTYSAGFFARDWQRSFSGTAAGIDGRRRKYSAEFLGLGVFSAGEASLGPWAVRSHVDWARFRSRKDMHPSDQPGEVFSPDGGFELRAHLMLGNTILRYPRGSIELSGGLGVQYYLSLDPDLLPSSRRLHARATMAARLEAGRGIELRGRVTIVPVLLIEEAEVLGKDPLPLPEGQLAVETVWPHKSTWSLRAWYELNARNTTYTGTTTSEPTTFALENAMVIDLSHTVFLGFIRRW